MVARPIHRHVVADRHYPGARAGRLDDLAPGEFAVFGADAVSARAVRDAAAGVFAGSRGSDRHVDLGDLNEPSDRLHAVLEIIVRRDARPVMLGGDAGLGTAFAAEFARSAGSSVPTMILMSPRLDVRPPRGGVGRALALGTARLIGRSGYDAWHAAGGEIIPAATFDTGELDAALSRSAGAAGTALLLVDMAVIDTGYAAGATFRNIGGSSPIAVIDAAERIAGLFDIRGLAFLNLAPERDPRGHSERIAAMIAERIFAQGEARRVA
jgi:arginase family enzyme